MHRSVCCGRSQTAMARTAHSRPRYAASDAPPTKCPARCPRIDRPVVLPARDHGALRPSKPASRPHADDDTPHCPLKWPTASDRSIRPHVGARALPHCNSVDLSVCYVRSIDHDFVTYASAASQAAHDSEGSRAGRLITSIHPADTRHIDSKKNSRNETAASTDVSMLLPPFRPV